MLPLMLAHPYMMDKMVEMTLAKMKYLKPLLLKAHTTQWVLDVEEVPEVALPEQLAELHLAEDENSRRSGAVEQFHRRLSSKVT